MQSYQLPRRPIVKTLTASSQSLGAMLFEKWVICIRKKVLTRVSLRSPRRLTRIDTFCSGKFTVYPRTILPYCIMHYGDAFSPLLQEHDSYYFFKGAPSDLGTQFPKGPFSRDGSHIFNSQYIGPYVVRDT